MPKIIIQNLHNKVIFTKNEAKTLLDNIHQNDIDWMHACGGKGRCTTCKTEVIEGLQHCSPVSEAELKYRASGKLSNTQRLTCQTQISGDVQIRVATENQFDHLLYSV